MSKYGAIPNMAYKNPEKILVFLKNAFGFSEYGIYRGPNDEIQHAQLILGNALIMISPAKNEGEIGQYTRTPAEVGGFNTQTPYLIIDEIDAHYKKAKDAGAEIIRDIKDEDYGGRGYSCKDPEGYIWNFGSYNPFSKK